MNFRRKQMNRYRGKLKENSIIEPSWAHLKTLGKLRIFLQKKRKSFWEVSEKSNEQIPRKVRHGRTNGRTNPLRQSRGSNNNT